MSVALPIAVVGLLALVGACRSAATDTLTPRQVLAGNDTLVSNNSKFTLGFFKAPDGAAGSPDRCYLGIWFTAVPGRTTVWVANGANPIIEANAGSPELAITGDGDLAVVNNATKLVTWSARPAHDANTTTAAAVAVLLNSGNLVLLDASNSSSTAAAAPRRTLWQSFDHPTDTLLPSAKLGLNRATGASSRLVSRLSSATPSPGPYCFEVDPGAPQLVLRLCDSSPVTTYWATGAWNGRYFSNIPEMAGDVPNFHLAFVDDASEEYLQFNVTTEATVTRNFVDVTGQNRHQVWLGASKGWLTLYAGPKAQCDVYAACGPFTVCSYTAVQLCSCMKGFSVRSPMDWEQGDRTGGCVRDAPLDCSTGNNSNGSAPASTSDGFFPMPSIGLPDNGRTLQNARSSAECSTACLTNCSCTAYSYGGGQGCLVWQGGLLNAKQPQSNGADYVSDVETLHLRLAATEFQTSGGRKRGVTIGAVTGACAAALVLLALAVAVIIRRRKKTKNGRGAAAGGGLTAFSYRELRSATKNFSEKLGQGGFGSVFKGQLRDSTGVAVKRLDGSFQGEKQFRAEVSSIGVIQHVNLVRLVGFCCEGERRFLVYEHMPNRSLDIHLFQSGGVFLDWSTRYQIAVGVARGLSYLHDGCRDRIIHCDVKPENILLGASLLPKIADFGMAKFVGRDFSRVLTTMRGTKGYLAPEWIGGTAITPKVDVYSYGMVLLELVSGRRNAGEQYCTASGSGDDDDDAREELAFFPMEAARELVKGPGVVSVSSLMDGKLCGDADLVEVERACKVACWCIQDDEADRPTMGEVVQILEGVLDCDMPPLPRLLETIFGRPHSSTEQQTTTVSGTSTSQPFTSGSGSHN